MATADKVREIRNMRQAIDLLNDDDVFGRSVSLRDLDEFDEMYPRFSDVTGPEGPGGDELDLRAGDPDAPMEAFQGDEPDEFERPVEVFPVLRAALDHFEAETPKGKTVRIDTPTTYGAIAPTGDDVPLDLPLLAKGNIQAWQEGDHVIVSVHFEDARGGHKIASMSAPKSATVDEVKDRVRGLSPFEALGALSEVTARATGEKLVKDAAAAALTARNAPEVCGMDGSAPVVRAIGASEGSPTIAALMYLQQRAEAGDEQAAAELEIIRSAAETESGKQIAAPLLAEASRRLAAARAKKVLR